MADEITLKESSFGACGYAKRSPVQLTSETPAVNLMLSFEDALKLNLAIDECVRKLGRYNRATTAGKTAGLQMIVHFDTKRIRIQEGKV